MIFIYWTSRFLQDFAPPHSLFGFNVNNHKRVNNQKIESEFRHAKSVIIDTSALLASGKFFFTKKCLKLALKRLKVA